jgi:sec-independent protein translocase protein TatB
MFEVGFTEIVLILGLALLVLGPEKLPGLAEKVGRWTGRARAMARQLRTQLEHEVTMEELSRSRPAPAASPETPAAESSSTPESSSTGDNNAAHAASEPPPSAAETPTTMPAEPHSDATVAHVEPAPEASPPVTPK